MVTSVRPATNPNAPKLPYQTGEPEWKAPSWYVSSPIPGWRPEPPPLGIPLNPNGKRKSASGVPPPSTPSLSSSGTSPKLEMFLRQFNSGHKVLDDDMYNYFGGDDLLKEIQKIDPNARWTETPLGNEGGYGMGRRLDFDVSKMPTTKSKMDWMDARPTNWGGKRGMINPDMVSDDPIYGKITHAKNFKPEGRHWMDYAPMAIGGLAGIMSGGAAMPLLARLAMSGIQGLPSIMSGNMNPLISAGLGAIPGVGQYARHLPTLYQISQQGRG